MILLYLAVGLLVFTIIGMPLGYSIGLSSMFSLLIENPMFLNMFPQRVWAGAYGYTMICLPLFMLMGELANKSGFTDNMTNILLYIVKPIRGGIAEVNVLQSMFFGGISGSSVADVAFIYHMKFNKLLISDKDKIFFKTENLKDRKSKKTL